MGRRGGKGGRERVREIGDRCKVICTTLGTGDQTDQLFHVNSASESNPGRVTVTGALDREAESMYTINIQVGTINQD